MTSPSSVAVTMCSTLLDEWIAHGLRDVVVSPGSRSTPMVIALSLRDDLRIHVFHDERSAAFAALGIALSQGAPAMLLCTSGTAAAEFFPAVAEASQACVPLLVCTADRPPELQGIGAPQTMDQVQLYGRFARNFVNVSPPSSDDATAWRPLARSAWESSVAADPGPVHINLQFREPLVGEPENVPPRDDQSVPRHVDDDFDQIDLAELRDLQRTREGVIVAGAGVDDPRALLALGERLGWPVIADPRSGCRIGDSVIVHADAILRHVSTAERLRPRVIWRFGEPPASKVVNQWIAKSGAHVIAVSGQLRRIDPDRIVSRHLVAKASSVAAALDFQREDRTWTQDWQRCEDMARSAIARTFGADQELSEPWVASVVSRALDVEEVLMLSSSMPIRDVEWFAERCPSMVVANRGVNGIDGVISTGIGLALGIRRPVTVLIGDVAFLHDSNALINLIERDVDVRIVVVDNQGGGIFSFLDQARALSEATFERFFGTPHRSQLVALAQAHGVAAQEAKSREEVHAALRLRGPRVIVVKTDREDNVAIHDRLNRKVADALNALATGG